MKRVFSTYRYVNQPLTPTTLTGIAKAGIRDLEIFCATSHFLYGDAQVVKDLAFALEENHLSLHSLHSPTERNIPISIADPERIRRIDAMDEVKRALEVAERIPFKFLVQHIGHSREALEPRKLDAAFSSLEHLSVFAKQRGVTVAIENTPSELASPESLRQFVKETHLRDVRFCFDIGHANLEPGVPEAFEFMRHLVVTTHIHDNHGEKDEHLLPFEGGIDWFAATAMLAGVPEPLPIVLELKDHGNGSATPEQAQAAFDKIEKQMSAS